MGKTAKYAALAAVILLCCTSCYTIMTLALLDRQNQAVGVDFGKQEAVFDLTTIQKINDNAALAQTGKGDIVCLVADFNPYYDGLTRRGRFVCMGTMAYMAKAGYEKHVLVYVPKKDAERLRPYAEELLEE